MTPAEGAQALVAVRERISRLEHELEEAKAERKDLEEIVLPPIFLQAGNLRALELANGARAVKSLFAYARLAKSGPKRLAMLDWLVKVGEKDVIKPTLAVEWGRGEYEIAKKVYEDLRKSNSAKIYFEERVQWKSLESIILERVKRGEHVPLDDIGATVGDHVTITVNPKDPTIV